jgi:formamidopyrimidine-DNA glycosylase
MNASVVVGVGNIYANESLFLSGIHPKRRANNIGKKRYQNLAQTIKSILTKSIEMGGTTLRNFSFTYGKEKIGYFKHNLFIYSRDGKRCEACGSLIKRIVLSGRGTFYCGKCQR